MTQPTNPTNEQELREQIISLISGDYASTRVWEAWQVGTMTQDDFEPLEETERPDEILELIQAHTNAEITRTLDRLQHGLDGGRTYTSVSLIKDAIQAERAKLKEEK